MRERIERDRRHQADRSSRWFREVAHPLIRAL
jgi:hypothetical protein